MGDVPLAISPSVMTPGTAIAVNLKAGAVSPGTGALRALLIGFKLSTGTITAESQIKEAIAGETEAGTLSGAGGPVHLAAKRLFEEYGLALVDYVATPTPAGTAASFTITFAGGPPTVAHVGQLEICGRLIPFVWDAGVTASAAAQLLRDAILSLSRDLPITAAESGGVLTVTAKAPGIWGNDIEVYIDVLAAGTGGTITPAGLTSGRPTNGAGEQDVTTALTTVSGREYHLIILVGSSADAQSAAGTSNPARIKTHIEQRKSGLTARLQQWVGASNDSISGVKTATAALNHDRGELLLGQRFRSLPGEIAGAEAGARLREESNDPAVNRIRRLYRGTLFGPRDSVTDKLTDTETEDLLQKGVTPVDFEGTDVYPTRPRTTYWKDLDGNADTRVIDVSVPTGTDAVAKDMRVALPSEFPGRKIIADLAPGDEIPDNCVTISEVRTFVIGRVLGWTQSGVVNRPRFLAAVADGSFICRINPSSEEQVDLVIPTKIVKPLAKFSVVVNHNN
jgi:phage tail sheath gpL-like